MTTLSPRSQQPGTEEKKFMLDSFNKKQTILRNFFSDCCDKESKYNKIIEMGRNSPRLSPEHKIEENIVHGCQSIMYLHSFCNDEKIYFEAESDALISSGLAVLLITVYTGESPEIVLKYPPIYLEELDLIANLTPNRANGIYSIYLKMKQEALRALVKHKK